MEIKRKSIIEGRLLDSFLCTAT